MDMVWPASLETTEALDEAIVKGEWPEVWSRHLLEVSEDHAELWMSLAREVWRTARIEAEVEACAANESDSEPQKGSWAPDTRGIHTSVDPQADKSSDTSRAILPKVVDKQALKCTYSTDERIARLLLGHGDPCEGTAMLSQEQQDMFEQSTFSEIRRTGQSKTTDRDVRLIYIKLIEKGRERGLWDLCCPSYPVLISRPIPRNQPDNLTRLFKAREVRTTLIAAIRKPPPWLAENQVGAILLSAMLWDGLLEKAAIDALAQCLGKPLVRGPSGYWLDLLLYPDNPARTRIRRFWLNPLTTLLWLRYDGEATVGMNADLAIESLLSHLCENGPPTISELIKGIAQEISLELPEVLVHVATGQSLTYPIKAERWHVIQGIGRPGETIPELIEAYGAQGAPTSKEYPKIESNEKSSNDPLLELVNPPGMVGLRKAMRAKGVREMVKALERVLQDEALQPPIINHLARWLKKPSTRAKASTRSWMFGLIGARLVSICGDDEPWVYDDDELEHTYASVIEDGKSTSQRIGMRYALTSFHRYLSKGDPLKRPALLNEIERSEVSSRVVTHEEYHNALKLLGQPRATDEDPQWLQACQLALILFFRLGMRRRELLWLPLHDIHGRNSIEILVRPFTERTLKTSNALRTLHLNGFLSEKEFSLVQDWLERRRNEAIVNPGDFYFFSLSDSERVRIPEARVIDRIVEALRSVSGDPNIHLHHLRHSFATWTTMSLIGDVIEDDFRAWSHMPDTQQWLRTFPAVIKAYSLREAPQRNLLYQVATLMGHSTPAITMEHYIHATDYLLGSAMCTAMELAPEDIGRHGTGLSLRTYQRWVAEGWQGMIARLAMRFPDRWNEGECQKQKNRKTSFHTKEALYQSYFSMWQAMKWTTQNHTLDNDCSLSVSMDIDKLQKVKKRADELNKQGWISNAYPYFPHGKRRESIAKTYAHLFEAAMLSEDGQHAVNKIGEFWLQRKVKCRGALRFADPLMAKKYIECLLIIGISWSQLNLNWVGSRYTRRDACADRAYWRKAMGLSRRIPIGVQSIKNDRPLSGTRGYMDIRVLNLHDNKTTKERKSSVEFQWVVEMLVICSDTRVII